MRRLKPRDSGVLRVFANSALSVTPWVTGLGYQNAFIVGACAGLAHNLTIFPIIKWGRSLRQKTSQKYWDTVKRGQDLDVTH